MCLWGSVGVVCLPDEGVDLVGLDVVELLDGVADLALVRLDVNDEDEGVVVLDLLHRRLSVERVDDRAVGVHPGGVDNRLAGVLGLTGKRKGLGAVVGE